MTRTGGKPLAEPDRNFFEQRYGYSFDNVRIHADGPSASAARSVGARAYTLGSHIVFNSGEYAPASISGRRLLGHELAHVVQQSRGGPLPGPFSGSSIESGARTAASAAVLPGAGMVPVSGASSVGLARDALSLIQNLDPSRLSDFDLQQETLQVNAWLSQHAYMSDPNTEQMTNALHRLEAEARKRHARHDPPPPRRPLLPSIKGGGAVDLESAMAVIDAIHPSDNASGVYTMDFQGEEKTLSQEQYDLLKRRARNLLIDHIGRVESKNAGTRAGYASQKATDRDHWLVAPIVKFLGNVQDPGPYLDSAIADADSFEAQARDALKGGHYAQAAEFLARGETRALSAERMWQAYFQGIISAGEMTITALEITRDAAFLTLAVLAAIPTGGASAGAAATAFGVDLGVGVATATNVIAVGAPIVASLSEAAAKVANGDPVDWGELTLNIAISIFLARFGGKATEGIAEVVLARVAKGVEQRVAKLIIKRAVQSVILHAGSTALTVTLNTVYKNLTGQKITWQQFMDQLVKALTDPKGLAVTAVTTAIATRGEIQFMNEQAPAVTPSEPPQQHQEKLPPPPEQKQTTPPPADKNVAAQPDVKQQNAPPPAAHETPGVNEAKAATPPPPPEHTGAAAGEPEHLPPGEKPNVKPDTTPPAEKPKGTAKKPKIQQPSAQDLEAAARRDEAAVPKAKPHAKTRKASAAKKSQGASADKTPAAPAEKQSAAAIPPGEKTPAAPAAKVDISKQHTYSESADPAKGLKYKTAEGDLGVPGEVEKHRSQYAQSKVSAGTGDDAGHLIANIFGGSGGEENLSLQNWKANEYGTFKKLENAFRSKLESGYKVRVKVTDVARIDSDRPYHRIVEWSETAPDGKVTQGKLDFANMHTPESRAAQKIPPTTGGDEKDNVVHVDFRNKPGGPPDQPPPAAPAALKPPVQEAPAVDPAQFKGGRAANDNIDLPPEPKSNVIPLHKEMPLEQPMKKAAGDYEHMPAPHDNTPVAMANTPKSGGGSPKSTVAQPGEHANVAQGASKSSSGAAHEPPVPPATHATDPAFENKVKAALDKIPETTFEAYLDKPIERGQVPGRVLMDAVKKVDPALHDNMKIAVESLHNRRIWETVIRRIQAERTRVAQGQSGSTTYRQSLAAMNSQGLKDARLARSIELERPGSHSSEAVWNLAEQAHGKTPEMVVHSGDFSTQPGAASKGPFKGSFYDVNISAAGAVEEKPWLANEPTHGVSHHMIQDLVITEGFQQAGKTGYTAESLRNDMSAANDKLHAATGKFDRGDLWNFTNDSLESNGQMTAPENVNPIINSIFPDMR